MEGGPDAFIFFFFNDTATTEIYTLFPTRRSSDLCVELLLDEVHHRAGDAEGGELGRGVAGAQADRKSTRLNSSHLVISYAVFCLKTKYLRKVSVGETVVCDKIASLQRCRSSFGSL